MTLDDSKTDTTVTTPDISTTPDIIATTPDIIATTPDIITTTPDIITTTPDIITTKLVAISGTHKLRDVICKLANKITASKNQKNCFNMITYT
ncbi:7629_t:CDS:2 [Cetraspora pellucida]|uniref:7629_t:CDS:1 n=1 Tax=Cetraspora pellucida TaxID=1433469 RepID=A0ACA9K3T4_9GLOM|nr:7629_t:CDS:2 [Cetraspora pellucida]